MEVIRKVLLEDDTAETDRFDAGIEKMPSEKRAAAKSADQWKAQYNSAKTVEDRTKVVKDCLINSGVDENKLGFIDKLGGSFINRWVNSMKWTELSNKNNYFNKMIDNNINNFATDILSNPVTFTKAYNVYSSGLVDSRDIQNTEYVLYNKDLYRQDGKSIIKIVNMWNDVNDNIEPGEYNEKVRDVFFDENGNVLNEKDIESVVKNPNVSKYNNKVNYSDLNKTEKTSLMKSLLSDDELLNDREIQTMLRAVK